MHKGKQQELRQHLWSFIPGDLSTKRSQTHDPQKAHPDPWGGGRGVPGSPKCQKLGPPTHPPTHLCTLPSSTGGGGGCPQS